ncbi:MAG TPA: hypothetical protein DEE98_08770 [Elusimicrobia bacterium]|nr:MAG: hypothetical protein A2386_03045 [Elusimicrobia bacterium RIFOXYB1_FULL_48_9]OGS15697.1 MAG: hypothetical protein A2251_08390 [Elusimicrobia bacterium RIFOXYA2_FULL_47_53]OGS27084.1 MAG: hypothetical protein A2339_01230 [Elusimicrobia bacterium RIFOXYB12_FULL_50_12]OGS30998.1 MAG: hypothetical protein A2323_06710 [Elusimicrobia bacterium RIFOXYB2_FULL_46_23]HBU70454.1 hypothetical protein [Elusimicrobiota bacterium]
MNYVSPRGLKVSVFAALLVSLLNFQNLSAAFDDIGIGARGRGFGGAYSAVVDDSSAIFWNPAALGRAKRKEVSAFYQDLYGLGLVNYNALGYIHPRVGKGTVGFGWIRLGTTPQVSFMNYSENTFVFSYGQYVGRSVSLGANMKYYSVLYDYKASGIGLDLACLYEAIKDKLKFSFVWENINNPAIYWETLALDNLPSEVNLGAAYWLNPDNVISLEGQKKADSKAHYSAGFESWFFRKSLAFRAGLKEQDDNLNTDIGMSLGFKKIRFDYTLERHYKLGYSSLISFSVEF